MVIFVESDIIFLFRAFCDALVRPEDSELFANAACIFNLEDTLVSNLMEPETFEIEDHDITLPQEVKIRNELLRNVEVRASTSLDSLKSFEEFKAEKLFSTALNQRHYNRLPFTKLLRMGTNVCCHYQETLK